MYENKDFSNCVKELEKLYERINNEAFLPMTGEKITLPVFITIASQGKRSCYGWCSFVPFWNATNGQEGEKYEINISAETLGRPIGDTFVTLAHEMVHLYHVQKGVKDTSGSSGRHNKKFQAGCEKIGLKCEDSGTRIGYTTHFPVTECGQKLQDILSHYCQTEHPEYLSVSRISDTKGKVKKRGNNSFKLACPCCGASVRATAPTISIKCNDCDEVMERAL